MPRLPLAGVLLAGLLAVAPTAPGQPAADTGLDGTWQIVTLIDDGALIPPASVADLFVKDGRLTIRGNALTLTRPGQAEARSLPFVADPRATPKTLDIAGTEKVGSRGIYLHDGDTLIVCLAGHHSAERPTDFGSCAGTQKVFMTLRRVTDAQKPAAIPVGLNPPVPPAVAALPPPPPVVLTDGDDVVRQQLVGTWGHQTDDAVSYTTLNPDGTFSSTLTWKKGFRRMFHEDVRNSGTWKVESGSLVSKVTASTNKAQMNQLYTFKISSIDGREAVFIEPDGRTRREWKVR